MSEGSTKIFFISVISDNMRSALFVAFASIVLGLLSERANGAKPLDEAALRYEMKKSYCLEQRGKRFYKTENLDDLCALKVGVFDEQVSCSILNE